MPLDYAIAPSSRPPADGIIVTSHAIIGVRLDLGPKPDLVRGCDHEIVDGQHWCSVCGAKAWHVETEDAAVRRFRRTLEASISDTPLVVAYERDTDGESKVAYVGWGVAGSSEGGYGVALPDLAAVKRVIAERLSPFGVQVERGFGLWSTVAVG